MALDSKQLLSDLLWDKQNARDRILSGEVDPGEIPLPEVTRSIPTDAYRFIPVSSTLVNEPLAVLSERDFRLSGDYYFTEAVHNPVYRKNFTGSVEEVAVLSGLIEPLCRLNTILKDIYDIELEPMNGFRPLPVQKEILNCFYRDALAQLQNTYSGKELEERAMQHALLYASRPPEKVTLEDPTTWYTHGTGAALDVVLAAQRGGRLEFGSMFDDPSAHTNTCSFEAICATSEETATSVAARKNRRVLFWGMAAIGFVNYPLEYFHFDPFNLDGKTTQFAILNATSWGIDLPDSLQATVPPTKELLQ